MTVKTILVAMVVAALACIAAPLLLPSAYAWPAVWMLVALLAILTVLALRRAARDRRHAAGGMDLGRLREPPREVSEDDTAW